MSPSDHEARARRRHPSLRDEVLRSQLEPVWALALAAATLIGLLIIGQYAWLRMHSTNPLDRIETEELTQVLSAATPEQWPVLARWIAVYGLGMTIGEEMGVPSGRARLAEGREVPITEVVSLIIDGRRIDAQSGRSLGPAPPFLQTAIGQLPERGPLRLAAGAGGDSPGGPWLDGSMMLIRLDAQRVVVLVSPDETIAASDLARVVAVAFGLTGVATAVFVSLFLLAFRGRFAARSARRLSDPIERLAAAVRLAASARDAASRVRIEAPAEVAQLAEDFNRTQEQLSLALHERERVIAGQLDLVMSLSHELRTPLTVLSGHAEVLSRDETTADRGRIMLRQIEDLHRLLSDLLDLARLESIEATLATEDVRMASVVAEMLERFAAPAWRQGVLLKPAGSVDPDLAARADPRWLRQIVANLLGNAIRHTPAGGLVTLDARRHDGWVRMVIEDTGVGLGASLAGYDVGSRSAGVGLRVVRRIVVAMRGSLRLEATDEGGARAVILIPALMLPPLRSSDRGSGHDRATSVDRTEPRDG
jgi:signal transduction histidine kinase